MRQIDDWNKPYRLDLLGLRKNDPAIRFPYVLAQSLQLLSEKPSFFFWKKKLNSFWNF